jgi:sulfotransferase
MTTKISTGDKKFFFLAGLQRSGATLLSAILSQNPNIWVSPASPLLNLMTNAQLATSSYENIDYDRTDRIDQCVAALPHVFYGDKEQKIVIDKNLNWATVPGINTALKYISASPKIICCVRSIPEILASFDTIISKTKDSSQNIIDTKTNQEIFPQGSLADRRAEYLMRHDLDIQLCLNGMKSVYVQMSKDTLLFVEYDDLVENPEAQIKRIYEFLEIEHYEHEYENIEDAAGISEISVTGIRNLHKVRPKIKRTSPKAEEVLSKETITRYSGLEFWRNLESFEKSVRL